MSQKQVRFNYIVPTVHADGTSVFISNEGDVPTLNFIQARNEDDNNVYVDVVASVRLIDLKQLESLQQEITETISEHKNREV